MKFSKSQQSFPLGIRIKTQAHVVRAEVSAQATLYMYNGEKSRGGTLAVSPRFADDRQSSQRIYTL